MIDINVGEVEVKMKILLLDLSNHWNYPLCISFLGDIFVKRHHVILARLRMEALVTGRLNEREAH